MARLVTSGFRFVDLVIGTMPSVLNPAPYAATTGYSSLATDSIIGSTTRRSPQNSLKFDSGASATEQDITYNLPAQSSTTLYCRTYFRFANLPTTGTCTIMDRAGQAGVRLTTGGLFQLWNLSGTPAQIGSDSATTVTAGDAIWYCVELSMTFNATPQLTACEARINGVSIASTSGLTIALAVNNVRVGWITASVGANIVCNISDTAINDSTGSFQNSWLGDSKIVVLAPVSNNSVGNWLSGSGASGTNDGAQWGALDSTPSGTASPDATVLAISNAVSGASNAGIGDFNMDTYGNVGIQPWDTINCITMVVAHGEDASTGAKTGTFNIVSNPTQSGTDTIGQANTAQFGLSGGGAVGTAHSVGGGNWVRQMGTVQYNPVVDVHTGPVCRINKTDTGTRAADCCFMGLYVDYSPGIAPQHFKAPLFSPLLAQ